MNKRLKLLDPTPEASGGGAAPSTTGGNDGLVTRTVTGFPGTQSGPTEDSPDDHFLDPTKPTTSAPTEKPKLPEPVPGQAAPAPVPELDANGKPIVKPPEPAPTPATYTSEQVAELLKKHNTGAVVPAPAPAPKPLSPDEINKQLNVYTPTAEDLTALGLDGSPATLAAFNKIGQALVKNAVTVANVIIGDHLSKLRAEYQPHVAFAQEQQQQMYQYQYFQDHPAHQGLEPLITQVATEMVKEGFKGTPKQTNVEVGKRVDALMVKLGIPPKNTTESTASPAAPVVTTKPTPTRMSTTTSGGQGGAGGAGGGKGEDPEAKIWS